MTYQKACGFFWAYGCAIHRSLCGGVSAKRNTAERDAKRFVTASFLAVAMMLASGCENFGAQARLDATRETECTTKCNTLCLNHVVNAYPCRCRTEYVNADCALAKDGAR